MSKVASRLKGLKKAATDKVRHGTMRTNIPAGMAAAGPPLGPMLGQVVLHAIITNTTKKTIPFKFSAT